MQKATGVINQAVPVGGAAFNSGLRALDVILSADGQEYNNSESLISYIASQPVSHPLKLHIWRNRTLQDVTVPLGASAPDFNVSKAVAAYCYVTAMPVPMAATNNLVWSCYVFAVPGSTELIAKRGESFGNSFKSYLQQQGMTLPPGLRGFPDCTCGFRIIS